MLNEIGNQTVFIYELVWAVVLCPQSRQIMRYLASLMVSADQISEHSYYARYELNDNQDKPAVQECSTRLEKEKIWE